MVLNLKLRMNVLALSTEKTSSLVTKTIGVGQKDSRIEEDPNKQRWNNLSTDENNYTGSKQIMYV